ncbi:MAG: VOC family protein [Acidimicrobiales bacterium]
MQRPQPTDPSGGGVVSGVGGARLDHVALAAESALDNFVRYYGELGGAWYKGGYDPGFYWGTLRYANGMKVELLEPTPPDRPTDSPAGAEVDATFLRRFLDRNGPGPHHITFKVDDIFPALDAVRAAGFEPVGVSTHQADWKEAFLHPRQSFGVVVQLSQSASPPPDPALAPVLPPLRRRRPGGWASEERASLARIVLLVAELEPATVLFGGLLGGVAHAAGADAAGEWVELAWAESGSIRLHAPRGGELGAWLGERPGRVHHLHFELDDPAGVSAAEPLGEGLWTVPPEANLGVRLLLSAG